MGLVILIQGPLCQNKAEFFQKICKIADESLILVNGP